MSQHEMAVGFLILIAIAPVAYFLVWSRKSPFDPFRAFWYLLSIFLARVLWRAAVPPMPVPPGQGAVLVSNHRSSVDPFFIELGSNRHVHWMVAGEYFKNLAFGWFLILGEAIPVSRRGVDTAATRKAIRLVSEGELVGMFPEGRINRTDEFMLPGRPGAILVALKARVPVVPCYIQGSPYNGTAWSPFLMPAKVTVRFGDPIDLSQYCDGDREPGVAGQMMLDTISAIARLAGHEEFEPRLAGRRWRPTPEELERDMSAGTRRSATGPDGSA
jgi:1-acyl-sn-glycerol-3-phosphate acyltransferase